MPSFFTSVGVSTGPEAGVLGDGSYRLSFPLNVDLGTSHYGLPKGSTGRNGQTIVAICVHVLEATIETYKAYLNTSLNLADVRPGEHGSVHYGVEAGGALHEFVAPQDTAWAIQDLHNPTWSLLTEHVGVNVNYLTLNVGVERFLSPAIPPLMFRALADLIAFLCSRYAIRADADHIISHTQLEDTYDACADALATNLIASVQALLAQGNVNVSLDISVIASQLAALTSRVEGLESDLGTSLTTIGTFADHVTTKAGPSTLGHIIESTTVDVNSGTGAADVVRNLASYKVASGTQTIVSGIASVVQFPTVIFDSHPSSAPAWVNLGVLHKVTPDLTGPFRLRARVQFLAATWTAGKYIQLDVYKNGSLLETIDYKVIEANLTSKIVSVQGECEFVISTVGDYFQVKIVTDDSNGLKTIDQGNCFVERVGA